MEAYFDDTRNLASITFRLKQICINRSGKGRKGGPAAILLGFLGGDLDGGDLDLLIGGVGRKVCSVFVRFNGDNLSVLVLLLALAFDRSVGNDGEDEEHPQ